VFIVEAWQEASAHGRPYEYNACAESMAGIVASVAGVPVRDAQGHLVQWFGTDTDIEERKRAEEALRDAQADLAHARG
jgi:PAS domain-containing protein